MLIYQTEKNTKAGLNVEKVRQDFPILHQKIHGKSLAFLDNAASTQKPQCVIDAINKYYSRENANIHRAVYYLSEIATEKYEDAREAVRNFINAASNTEIVFTSGTTDSINLVATSYGRKFINPGDEVIISHMEHHSNIVPWQLLCEQTGAKLKIIPINDDGEIIFEEYEKLLSDRTRLVSVVYISNSLGTINPVREIIDTAHERGVPVLLDGAQVVAHQDVDVQQLDCDFFVFSGHKLFGPTGVGVLYAKEHILEEMPPYRSGGDMIRSVTFEKTTFNDLPFRFEAGTPNIAGVIGLAKAIEYVEEIGLENITAHENELLTYGTELLSSINGLEIIGTAKRKASVISFVIDGVHPHDVGTFLDREGVAIRTGHHCTQPVMERFNVPATSRASIALYNREEDFDALARGIENIIKVFQ
ncbi:MAG: SufS family cysteine desulfurase [Aliifodinibius sp.]|nr:cysteine desulfurase [Fodinibius sp.]NIV16700.1 SufS family cysteine desulfurase [Fodinibius sp.]NIY30267.1 SufS family cysteine desulfurase [Fodinibius sp.]